MTTFLAELRRRKVIRVAGLYVVTAWLLVQVAETLLPAFGAPDWVLRTLVLVLVLCFVPVLVFAWAFELTPDGLQRDAQVDPGARAEGNRRLDMATLAVAGLAIGLFAIDRLVVDDAPSAPAAAPGGVAAEVAAPPDPAPAATPVAAPEDASIAVLPFVNMSADEENGYFADGLSEELLNVLARIDGLTVASRTSSFSFKGKDVPIPEIAAALGVAHVLEGSVRRQGARVRITAQLIRAGTDRHLWSQTWDRGLDDIFVVQEEIAQAIADELAGRLPVASRVEVTASTADFAAYERFLRGRTRFYRRTELPEAVADLEAAVARDPALGEAWLYLAAARYVLPGYATGDLPPQEAEASVEVALAEGRRRLPEHPLGLAIAGALAFEQGEVAASLETSARAAAQRTTDTTPLMWHGMNLLRSGHVAEAERVLAIARDRDPLVGINLGYHAIARLSVDGDLDAAEAEALRAAALGWGAGAAVVSIEANRRGEVDRARRLVGAITTTDPEFRRHVDLFAAWLGRDFDLAAYLDGMPQDTLIESLLAFGAHDEMLDRWLARIDDGRTYGPALWGLRGVWLPSTRPLREDPRFWRIADALGLVAAWRDIGWPDGCAPAPAAAGPPRLACPEAAP